MDIEIIDEPTTIPLKELLDYLNADIYTKMDKKEVEAIKSSCLGGSLLKAITTYKNKCVYEALLETRKLHSDQIDNFKEIIKGLRDGRDQSKEVYPENGFTLKD